MKPNTYVDEKNQITLSKIIKSSGSATNNNVGSIISRYRICEKSKVFTIDSLMNE